IGANTAIFSVVDGAMLRPLPYQRPDRLAMIWMDNAKQDLHDDGTSIPAYVAWRSASRRFADLAAYGGVNSTYLTGASEAEVTSTVRASANLFTVLGVQPRLGRGFTEVEVSSAE